MAEQSEDERQAASIQVAISNYVATASLAVLAGSVVLFTYVSQTFAPPWTFFAAITAGAVLLVASVFLGGRGSAEVAKEVGRGEWDSQRRIGEYNLQAALTLLGLVCVLVAAVVGTTAARRSSDLEQRVDRLAVEVQRLELHH